MLTSIEASFGFTPTNMRVTPAWKVNSSTDVCRFLAGEIVFSPNDVQAPRLEDRRVQGRLPQWKQRT
jgi:hypothetical protein